MSPRQDVDVARPGLRPCPHGSYNLWQPDRRGIARGSGCVPRPLSLDLFREPGLHPSGRLYFDFQMGQAATAKCGEP